MADPTMSILWSDLFYGNGDGDVMTGPYQNIITILGGPCQRNIGTGMELLFGYYAFHEYCEIFFEHIPFKLFHCWNSIIRKRKRKEKKTTAITCALFIRQGFWFCITIHKLSAYTGI